MTKSFGLIEDIERRTAKAFVDSARRIVQAKHDKKALKETIALAHEAIERSRAVLKR